MKIGHKLTLGFVSIALLIGAVGLISLHIGQKMLQEAIGESSAMLASQLLDKIDRTIYYRIEEFQAYATDTLLEKTTIESNTEFDNLGDPNTRIAAVESNWATPSGQPGPVMTDLMSNNLARELKSLAQFFCDKYGYAVMGEIFVTNKYGANIAQTGPTTDYYQADEEWWQVAKSNGLSVADVNFDESSGVYSTAIGVKITTDAGFAGVIKAVLNIQGTISILQQAKEAARPESTHLTLLTRDGKIIYSTRPFKYLEDASIQLFSRFGVPGRPAHTCYVIGANSSGKKTILAHAHSQGRRDYKGLGWILLMEHDSAEILAPIVQLRNTILLISLGIMVLAAAAGIITARSISGPIAALRKATVEIGKGNLDTTVAVRSSDEVGQLAKSFQAMAADLRKTVDNLNLEIAQRKSVQTSLKKSEERFRQVVENADEWIWEVDSAGLYKYSNQIVEKILGYTPQEIVNRKHFYDLFYPEDKEQLKQAAFEFFAKKQPFQKYPNRNVHKDGRTVWLLTSGVPILDDQGNLVGYRGVGTDITDHKLAEEAIRESEMWLKAILDNVQTAILIIDPETHVIVDANPRAADLIGSPRNQLVGSVCHRYVCPAEKGKCPITDLGQQVDNSERVLLTAEGQRPVIKTVTPIMLDGHTHLLESFVDITEHKKVEEELRESKHFLDNVFDGIQDGISVLDEHLDIIKANRWIEKMYASQMPLVGKKCFVAYQARTSPCPWCPSVLALKTGQPHTAIVPYPYSEPNATVIELSAFPLRSTEGKVIGVIEHVKDITERKKAQDALEKLNKDLEVSIQELSRSNKQLQDFVHIAAHDLKTPLRGIGTLAEWLATDYADRFDQQGRDQVALLVCRVKRIDKLIDAMLHYSRIERNRQREKPIELNALIKEIIGEIEPPANIHIEIQPLPVIVYSKTHIKQVFKNLLNNAISYMDKPDGRIKITCTAEEGFWKLCVSDNGPGIEQKHFEKVFEIFQTLSPRDELESAGMGLTTAKKIVELYGGKIWVESRPGQNSSFFFTCPVRKETEHAELQTHTAC